MNDTPITSSQLEDIKRDLLLEVDKLTQQIQTWVDDDMPQLYEAFLAGLFPACLLPVPAMTILRFSASDNLLHGSYIIPAGQEIVTAEQKCVKTQIFFTTLADLCLYPMHIERVVLQEVKYDQIALECQIRLNTTINISNLNLHQLPIYINTDFSSACHIFRLITSKVEKISVSFAENGQQKTISLGGQESIGMLNGQYLSQFLLRSNMHFIGFKRLLDYFSFRQQFMFFVIHGLAKINWPSTCSNFSIRIELQRGVACAQPLAPDLLQLHCVAAINLHNACAEPINVDQTRSHYEVVADNYQCNSLYVHSVNNVSGYLHSSQQTVNYYPIIEIANNSKKAWFYQQRTRRSNTDKSYLVLGGEAALAEQVLNCSITVFNGDIPNLHLPKNYADFTLTNMPDFITVTNLIKPSPILNPPNKKHYHWSLINHLYLNRQCLLDRDNLKSILQLYQWRELPADQAIVAAITALQVKPFSRITRGVLQNGLQIELCFQEWSSESIAEIYLFSHVLVNFFHYLAPFNTHILTIIHCEPSKEQWQWDSCSLNGSIE